MGELGSGGGSDYPGALDTNSTLEVNSPSASKTKVRAEVPNDLAAAIVAIQGELGTDPAGTLADVKTYLQTEHNGDGTHKNSLVAMLAGTQYFSGTKTFQKINYDADAGATDAYSITLSTSISSYTEGLWAVLRANTANTGAATLEINSLGAKAIQKSGGSALVTGDILEDDMIFVVYDATGDVFKMVNTGIGNDSITLAKIASGTAGDILYWNGSGDPTALAKGTDGQALILSGGIPSWTEATQATIGASAVGQGELKGADQDISFTGSRVRTQLTGGAYNFWPQLRRAGDGTFNPICQITDDDGDDYGSISGYESYVFLQATGTDTGQVCRFRYIQSSPPYDFGDGLVYGFIYALIENSTGKVLSASQAMDPPWLNGPSLTGKRVRKNGKMFIKRCKVIPGKQLDELGAIETEIVEINGLLKIKDMDLNPHPWKGNDLSGKTVVMLDPVSDLARNLMEMQETGDRPISMIGRDIKMDNTPLNRKGPKGLMIVKGRLR